MIPSALNASTHRVDVMEDNTLGNEVVANLRADVIAAILCSFVITARRGISYALNWSYGVGIGAIWSLHFLAHEGARLMTSDLSKKVCRPGA